MKQRSLPSSALPVLHHFTPLLLASAVKENPRYVYELYPLLSAIPDWSFRALTEKFQNKETIDDFVQRCHRTDTGQVIIGLHGYFALGTHFERVHKHIFEEDYHLLFFAPEYPTFRDIRFNGRYIGTIVKHILQETDATVTFLGHSLGCLVALETYYHRFSDAQRDRVSSLFLLGGPHNGVAQARYGYGISAAQMQQHSSYIRAWQERYPLLPDGHKIWSLSASHDAIVLKEDADLPIQNVRNFSLDALGVPHVSHIGVLYRPDVPHLIAYLMGKEPINGSSFVEGI